ncbi:MAG: ATP-binding protein [Pyrinomonadaceae bacterium]
MKKIDEILNKLEDCLLNNRFESIETEKIELKDLSGGEDWKQLYRSVCAFLNTDDGIVIVGIKEKGKTYKLTGYDENNENKLKRIPKNFQNENNIELDLSNNIRFEIRGLLDKKVCVIYVDKVPEDEKFTFFDKVAYKRTITGDDRVTKDEITTQNELKEELRDVRELDLVPNASISELNVDKLNEYLVVLNREDRIETYKQDIDSAISFLNRKQFIRNGKPTLLGMLVCGDNLFDFIGERADVDCYVDSLVEVAENKKRLRDNIIQLMDNAVGFVYKNIQVGVSYEKGGTKLPEYPEKLIREVINNSLAHRDYKINRFVSVDIKPNTNITVSNPGRFRQEQKIYFDDISEKIRIRRIIPIPKPRNPRLADILKLYDKYEAKSKGMSSLTNACLDNEIDVPYYFFKSENDISLVIPKGKVYDEESKLWLDGFSGYVYEKLNRRELTEEEKIILAFTYKSERLNRLERYTILLTKDNNHFSAIADLLDKGLIYKHPESPQIHPIYLVDRTLSKTEFSRELFEIFGTHYDLLSNEYKEVLNTIYLHNNFNKTRIVTAYSISAYLYFKKNIFVKDEKDYQNYKRKIRTIFNKLEEKGFIENLNKDNRYKPEYIIDKQFIPSQETLNFINS